MPLIHFWIWVTTNFVRFTIIQRITYISWWVKRWTNNNKNNNKKSLRCGCARSLQILMCTYCVNKCAKCRCVSSMGNVFFFFFWKNINFRKSTCANVSTKFVDLHLESASARAFTYSNRLHMYIAIQIHLCQVCIAFLLVLLAGKYIFRSQAHSHTHTHTDTYPKQQKQLTNQQQTLLTRSEEVNLFYKSWCQWTWNIYIYI